MQEPTVENLPAPVSRYLAATRPGFLTAAAVPVLIALAAAGVEGAVHWVTGLLTLLGAVIAHAGANVLNDYFDARAGCDEANADRVFPFTGGSRIIQNGVLGLEEMGRYGWLLLVTATIIGFILTAVSGPGLLMIGLAGMVVGWAYSAPPLRLCARGLGEPAVAVGFGVLIPLGTAYVQLGRLSPTAFWAALPFAVFIMLVLYINQFPDVRSDAATGKRNWVVRLGPDRARFGYPLLALFAYTLLVIGVVLGPLPWLALLGLATVPLHAWAATLLMQHAGETEGLRPAIVTTLNATMLHGILVTVGLVAASWLGGGN